MHKRDHLERYIAIAGFFICIMLVFIARLVTIQIAGQDYYTETVTEKNYTRVEPIQAQRGEIFDRNGKKLVGNQYTYSVYLDGGSFPKKNWDRNEILLRLKKLAEQHGEADGFASPKSPFEWDGVKHTINHEFFDTVYGKRLTNLMLGLNFKQNDDGSWRGVDMNKVYESLCLRYELIDSHGNFLYSTAETDYLFAMRLDMELRNFSAAEPYTIVKDVELRYIIAITEGGYRGYNISVDATREYLYPGYMSHLLGRVGKIYAENVEYYTSLGYSLNAIVGTSGVESAFESYLHGQDGSMAIVEDEYGNVVDKYVLKEPVAGSDVYLTIDVDLQMEAEKALENNVATIVEKAEKTDGDLDGEDANAGAFSAVKVGTGEILALASYPTYNLVTFNEDYADLIANESSPLFNRALEGTYPPGSTFKISVALAGLQEGIITPQTLIRDEGEYKYYADINFKPRCWIYSPKYGFQNHGLVDVHEAIQVSCNCFFYEVGRQLTITNITKYASVFGIGEPTGIEVNEKKGVLASPAYRESKGETWFDGDTVQAAIGQSDTLVTPLQLSNYIASVLNNGTRMKAHILYQVKDFSGKLIYNFEPQAVNSVELSPENITVVKNAMKGVTENGSASRLFVNYPIAIGGKTGTAQVSETSSDNALFTAFAPFDSPDIVCSCIIEHGANGTDAGYAVRDVFSYYFGLNKKEEDGKDDGGDTDGGDDQNQDDTSAQG